jgi:type IV pilus assembly protein PilY1
MTLLRSPRVPISSAVRSHRPARLAPLLAALLSLPVALRAGDVHAQADVDRPLPNVLLLVDSSGSMEFRADDNGQPVCHPGSPTLTNEKSRWIELVEVLTGTISGYSCFAQDRSSAAFRSEFKIGTTDPYDFNYVNAYHRIVSNNCVVGPGVLPSTNNPYEFPDKTVNTFAFAAPSTVTRPSNLTTHTGCSGFSQADDGLLDVFKDTVRFGLMTFDTHPSGGDGLDASNHMDTGDGATGTWSYFLTTAKQGKPVDCSAMQPMEVGARNAAAPPWEGRMVAFGAGSSTTADMETRNARIQQVLMATRPYGATPLAGMLDDAKVFLWEDKSKDPTDTSTSAADFGPYNDPLTKLGDCRRNIIILLSDGEPNLDLRPYCESSPDDPNCPYKKPEDIAYTLYHTPENDPDQKVETVVIGFALDKVTPAGGTQIACADLTDAQCTANPTNRQLQACCTLNKIAAGGGPANTDGSARHAFFPQNGKDLRKTISSILKNVTISLTTRTSPVFARASSSASGGAQQFSSSFVPLVQQPWAGKLTRTRILCQDGAPVEQAVDATLGDDFAANVNSNSPTRKFITFLPTSKDARATLRPYLSSDPDGMGVQSGSQTDLLGDTSFVAAVPAETLEVDQNDCDAHTVSACRDAVLGWTVVPQTNSDGETRCPSTGCNLFGAIYHSTPRMVPGSPNEFLRDESYTAFARSMDTSARPSVLYAATIDGQLHALKTAPHTADATQEVKSQANNELWSFFPPAVLPALQTQYPNTPATLLDGPIVTRDVPVRTTSTGRFFERTRSDATAGAGSWSTILVEGYGQGQVGSGFYALDVTNPVSTAGGPKFLWQLTRDTAKQALFGDGGVPLITTVFIKTSSTDPGTEVAVAVLPGGDKGTRLTTTTAAGPLMDVVGSDFDSATLVNAYSGAEAARSLTIVRLDTGEVLRSFRSTTSGTTLDPTRIAQIVIPAPIVGTPAAFPGATGSVADRIFVGDREGRIWRIDVSKSTPADWTMDVFFDLYTGQAASTRQPVQLAPVVSVDTSGRITVNAASGDQRVQTATTGMLHRVVSLTETFDSSDHAFHAKVNWIENLGCPTGTCAAGQYAGERVTGPMSLFGTTLYFASSNPAPATNQQCASGQSRVWGLHYIMSADEAAAAASINPLNGAYGGLPALANSTVPEKATPLQSGNVFGVSIEQQPSCSAELDQYTGDPYLGGYGSHTAISTVSPGKFFLVYQTGGVSSTSSNKVTTTKVELTPPRNSVWVDSWAPIFE